MNNYKKEETKSRAPKESCVRHRYLPTANRHKVGGGIYGPTSGLIFFLKHQKQSIRLFFPVEGPTANPDGVLMLGQSKRQNSAQSIFYARKLYY